MLRNVLFVAIGGAIGSVLRFSLALVAVELLPFRFPFGTFLVNVIGSFIMGLSVGLAERYLWLNAGWRIFLTAGFCGGFTTFSAFAFENAELLLDKQYGILALYVLASVTVCVLASLAGLMLTRT